MSLLPRQPAEPTTAMAAVFQRARRLGDAEEVVERPDWEIVGPRVVGAAVTSSTATRLASPFTATSAI